MERARNFRCSRRCSYFVESSANQDYPSTDCRSNRSKVFEQITSGRIDQGKPILIIQPEENAFFEEVSKSTESSANQHYPSTDCRSNRSKVFEQITSGRIDPGKPNIDH